VTFLFSTGLPIIIIASVACLVVMYWFDKYLVLRFYRTPKNWDESSINATIQKLKLTFVGHFLMGMLMLSNTNIMSDSDVYTKELN